MTGFATKTVTLIKDKEHKAHVSLSLKSLNARYFEVNAKLPYALSHLETDLIKLFKESLHRGYIYFTIHMDNPSIFKGSVEPSMGMVEGYAQSLSAIKKHLNLPDPITLDMIAHLPNIFNIAEQSIDKQSTDTLLNAINELIKDLISEREKEGKKLQIDMENRIAIMLAGIIEIEKMSALLVEEQKKKINAILAEVRTDQNDEQEIAETRKNTLYSVLDKMDIHEEIVRFKSHLENLQLHIDAKEIEKGKRLDFTLQELAREINTVTAKCSDASICKQAINIKVEIEKVREQTQNII